MADETALVRVLKHQAEEESEQPCKRSKYSFALPRWNHKTNKCTEQPCALPHSPERQETAKLERMRVLYDIYHREWIEIGVPEYTPDDTMAVLQVCSSVWAAALGQFQSPDTLRIRAALLEFSDKHWCSSFENWWIATTFFIDVEDTKLMKVLAPTFTFPPYTTIWTERHREARLAMKDQ